MDKLEIYHHLPYPMKVLGASLHGYYLRWWRYGKDTEKLVEEALERDTWTEPQWRSWQEERLAYILHGQKNVPPSKLTRSPLVPARSQFSHYSSPPHYGRYRLAPANQFAKEIDQV